MQIKKPNGACLETDLWGKKQSLCCDLAGGSQSVRQMVEGWALAAAPKPESPPLAELFCVVESWLSLKERRQDASDWQHWER